MKNKPNEGSSTVNVSINSSSSTNLTNTNDRSCDTEDFQIVEKDVTPNEFKLKYKVQKLLYEWCSNSTSHGLPNIVRTNHKILKIMWFVCFLISTGYCCYQIVVLLKDYFDYPVLVDIKMIHETPTQFPAITICNLNAFNDVEGKLFIDSVINDSNLASLKDLKSPISYTTAVLEAAKIELQYKNFTSLERKKYGYLLENMLVSCSFSETPCSVDDFRWFYNYEYGNCYTFNSGIDKNGKKNTKTVSKSGISFGLDLELFVGNMDGMQEYALKSGIILAVHNQTIGADLDDDGVHVPVGFDTHVLVQRQFSYKLDEPYSTCVKNTTSFTELESFEFRSVFNVSDNNEYNQRHCIKLCYEKFIESSCRCSDASLPKLNSTLNVCRSTAQTQCLSSKRNDFYGSEIFEECEKKCLPECKSIRYSVVTSSARYPTRWYTNLLKNNTGSSINISSLSYDLLKESILKVNIFYDSLAYTLLAEVPQIKIETEIANLGGEFGLFIGISILSFVELIELLFELLILVYEHKKRRTTTKPIIKISS